MRKINLKTHLVPAFCLMLFVGFTQAQTDSNEPAEEIEPANVETKPARRESRLRPQRQLQIKNWGRLKEGMTEKQVLYILGEPKLIQGGSDECTYFYPNGTVTFEAKTLEQLLEEEKTEHIKTVEKLNETYRTKRCQDNDFVLYNNSSSKYSIDPNYPCWWDIIVEGMENMPIIYKGEKIILFRRGMMSEIIRPENIKPITVTGKIYFFYSLGNDAPTVYSYEVGHTPDLYSLPEISVSRIPADDIQAMLKKAIKFEGQFNKFVDDYGRAVKRLSDELGERSPFFQLVYFEYPSTEVKEGVRITVPEANGVKWCLPRNWQQLKINMTVNQVHRLLGPPEKSEYGKECYGGVSGYGELYFSARSGRNPEERLDSWTEPSWLMVKKSLNTENQADIK
jgi:outer membrane protein assembly factor BamE (lipoprotein component of BamABCDE complex)